MSQRLHLRSSNKHVALQNLSIYHTLKNIRQQYKNNKLNLIAAECNNEFELPDGSVSDIQDYIEYIMKKQETLSTNPPVHIYINRINNALMFKINNRHKLELRTPEAMKLFGSTKKLIDKTKHEKNVPSIEVIDVVLVQCNLVDHQYQQKSFALYTFTPNKSYAYLLNVEPSNLGGIQLLRSHKMTKIWTTLPPCTHLIDFADPLSCERSKRYINTTTITTT